MNKKYVGRSSGLADGSLSVPLEPALVAGCAPLGAGFAEGDGWVVGLGMAGWLAGLVLAGCWLVGVVLAGCWLVGSALLGLGVGFFLGLGPMTGGFALRGLPVTAASFALSCFCRTGHELLDSAAALAFLRFALASILTGNPAGLACGNVAMEQEALPM